jgi:hypothetical protein
VTARRLVVLLALVAAGGSGCGGGSEPDVGSAAALAPATTRVFVTLDTRRLDGVESIAGRFPLRDRLLAPLRAASIDVARLRRASGPALDFAVLDRRGRSVVGFARPPDKRRFARILESRRPALQHANVRGWTVFSRDPGALAAVRSTGAVLEDGRGYRAATRGLPDEAAATIYARGEETRALLRAWGVGANAPLGIDGARWAAAAVAAHDHGLELRLRAAGAALWGRGDFDPTLAALVPEGAVAAVSFRDAGATLRRLDIRPSRGLRDFERSLGIRFAALADAVEGKGVFWIRPGFLVPELTLVSTPERPQVALASLERAARNLAPHAASPRTTLVGGTTVRELPLGAISILYGRVRGKIVVTDSPGAVAGVANGDRDRLVDGRRFRAVRDAASMPGRTSGWLYVDFANGFPFVETLAQLTATPIPRSVTDNLRPLRTGLLYGTREGGIRTFVAFLETT